MAATMTDPHVIVIGAGPAGSTTALLLARRGIPTLLVERDSWPRAKVCGGCLNAVATDFLRSMALRPTDLDGTSLFGAESLERCDLHAARSGTSIPMHGSRVIDRALFDAAIVERARDAGAEVVTGTTARVSRADPHGATVLLRDAGRSRSITCRLAVVAGGIGSRALPSSVAPPPDIRPGSRIGCSARLAAEASDFPPRGTLSMMIARDGYAGFVRHSDGTVDVAAALDPPAVRAAGGPGACICGIIRSAAAHPSMLHDLSPHLEGARWRGTPSLSIRRRVVAGHGWCTVGDACGYSEPFTGEGIGWALASAQSLADLLETGTWNEQAIRTWNRRASLAWRHRRVSSILARAVRHPKLFASALHLRALSVPLRDRILKRIGRGAVRPAKRSGQEELT